jgi:hypothetical protein
VRLVYVRFFFGRIRDKDKRKKNKVIGNRLSGWMRGVGLSVQHTHTRTKQGKGRPLSSFALFLVSRHPVSEGKEKEGGWMAGRHERLLIHALVRSRFAILASVMDPGQLMEGEGGRNRRHRLASPLSPRTKR